jgi:lipopolysaccharide transport system ATP-binding protein
MGDTVIRVENLSKKYVLSHQENGRGYKTFREALTGGARSLLSPFQNSKLKTQKSSREEFWALKDVSFEINQGDRVGIIGRNGAGKSTLLKILSRITEPTSGRIKIKGRVASLLEVGTGFHPELTGRENIYLNGAILGMSREEIKRKFDEIVDFAEIEKFLDTPVKRYSSGMYVRLAFAVAAHLEPEILIVDEVLAVGDAQFQTKCLGKMQNVASEGRTVIFVSHQMAAISNLCSTCLVLESGSKRFSGNTENAIKYYLDSDTEKEKNHQHDLQKHRPSWAAESIISVRLLDSDNREKYRFPMRSDITFEMTFITEEKNPIKHPVMGVVVNHSIFGKIGGVNTLMTGFEIDKSDYTSGVIQCTIKKFPCLQGYYSVDVWLGDGTTDIDMLSGCLSFRIEETDIYQTGRVPFHDLGVIFLEPEWQFLHSKSKSLSH